MKVQLGIIVLTIIVASVPAYFIVTRPNYTEESALNEGAEVVTKPDVRGAVREIVKEVPNAGGLPQIVEQPSELVEPPIDELPKEPIQPREPQIVRDPPPQPPPEPPIKIVEPPIILNPAESGGLLGQYWQDSFFGVWPLEEVPKCSEKGPRPTPTKLPEPDLTRNDTNFITAASRPLGNHEYSNSWTGILVVFAGGIYEFKIVDNGGDWAWMYIDKMLVQTSRGVLWGGGRELEGMIILDPGYHEISILRWDQCSLGDGVKLFWKLASDKEFTPLTAKNLRPKHIPVRLFVHDVICREWARCDDAPHGQIGKTLPISSIKAAFLMELTGSAVKRTSNISIPLVDLEIGKTSTIMIVINSQSPLDFTMSFEARNVPEGIVVSLRPSRLDVPKNGRVVVDLEITAFTTLKTENKTARIEVIARSGDFTSSTSLLLRVPEIRPNSMEAIADTKPLIRGDQNSILTYV